MVKCCLKVTCTAIVWKDVKDLAGVWSRKTADNDLREKKGNTLGWLDGRDIFLKIRALFKNWGKYPNSKSEKYRIAFY